MIRSKEQSLFFNLRRSVNLFQELSVSGIKKWEIEGVSGIKKWEIEGNNWMAVRPTGSIFSTCYKETSCRNGKSLTVSPVRAAGNPPIKTAGGTHPRRKVQAGGGLHFFMCYYGNCRTLRLSLDDLFGGVKAHKTTGIYRTS